MRASGGPPIALLVAAIGCSGVTADPPNVGRTHRRAEPAPAAVASSTAHGPATARDGDREVEVACNGTDDDGDGLIDVLAPSSVNACKTSLRGACSTGFASCESGRRVCTSPPPTPEVIDGVDNDCNGVTDDLDTVRVRPRALVLVPRYAWTESAPDIANVTAALARAGVPYDLQRAGTDWSDALAALDRFTLAIVPGYLMGSAVTPPTRTRLEAFARAGGVLVVFKPLGTPEQPQVLQLAGLTSSTRRRDILRIRFDAARPAAVAALDSPEERSLAINARSGPSAVEAYVLQPAPDATAVAHAFTKDDRPGAVITRRQVGKGAVYAVGHDLTTFAQSRCYVNCFEPAGDILHLLLEGALREGSRGHVVLKHTAKAAADSMLLVTLDASEFDAQNSGVWGDPGALQLAKVAAAHGVRATFEVGTDDTHDTLNPDTLKRLCELDMCPLGAYGFLPTSAFTTLPAGTCTETRATYDKPTVCGEIRMAQQVIKRITGHRARFWRSPYLQINPRQFDILAHQGFDYDSSLAVGDMPFNLPVDLGAIGSKRELFHNRPIIEFPITCEDAEHSIGARPPRIIPLRESNRARLEAVWEYVIARNLHNHALTTIRMQATRGPDMPPDNIRVKAEALARLLARASALGVRVFPLEEIGDFWRARREATVAATFDSATGYSGTIGIGTTTTEGLTLQFGDRIATFACDTCGAVRVDGKRVVIDSALPPGTHASFTAAVR